MSALKTVYPRVPASSVRWIVVAGRLAGLDVARLLSSVEIDPEHFADPDRLLPYDKVALLREAVCRNARNAAFALEAGARIAPGELGVVDYVCVSSPSLAQAMRNLSTYFRLVAHPNLELGFRVESGRGRLQATQRISAPEQLGWFERQSMEFTFSIILNRIRHATGVDVRPESVSFRHAPPDYAPEYERIFGVSPRFSCESNIMILGADVMALGPVVSDMRLYHLLEGYAQSALERLPVDTDIASRVLYLLKDELVNGEPTVQGVAAALCMSARTLHRRLAQEGTSFVALRDALRAELARSYLRDPAMSIADIAYLLGFSQASAFHRAFKRWTGLSPQVYREENCDAGGLSTSRA